MQRFIAKNLPLSRLYNAVVYSLSVILYSGIIFGLEVRSPARYVFKTGSEFRTPFMLLSIFAWALLIICIAVLLILYYPSKTKRSHGYADVSAATLSAINFAFFCNVLGLAIAVALGVIVFLASRERYIAILPNDTTRQWLFPIMSGLVAALFFLFMLVSSLRSLALSLRAYRYRFADSPDSIAPAAPPAPPSNVYGDAAV